MLCLLCNVSQQLCDWVEIMGVPLNNKVINQKSIYFLGFFIKVQNMISMVKSQLHRFMMDA